MMINKVSTRRAFLKNMALGAASIAISSTIFADETTSSKPNIVLIIGDDISMDDFGCYGHPHIRTPNIDALAQTGIKFTNAYLTASQCSPTRCSVISGRYPHNTGAPELHMPLAEGQPMFPFILKQAGYHTAAAGKWHLGDYAKKAFDTVVASKPGGEERWEECLQNRPKDKPFFMWFASFDAHRDWQEDPDGKQHTPSDAVIPPYMADMPGTRKDLARFYDEIQRLDRYTGNVIQKLKQQGVYDNTILIFMADNGRPFPRCKTWLYDSGIKTPLIVNWPRGPVAAGSISDSLVSVIDIAPTVLTLAGLHVPESMQGISFAPVLKNPKSTVRQYAFAEQNWHDMMYHQRMVRWKQYVYIRNARPQRAAWAYAHHNTLSYQDLFELQKQDRLTDAQDEVFKAPRPAEMLFDTDSDPHQLNDLTDCPEHKSTLEHLRNIMDLWQNQTGDTVPENLTVDNIDRKTFEWLRPWNVIIRGTIPGSERHATAINESGPR